MIEFIVTLIAAVGAALTVRDAQGGPPLWVRDRIRWLAGRAMSADSADKLVRCHICLSVYFAVPMAALAYVHPLLVAPLAAPVAANVLDAIANRGHIVAAIAGLGDLIRKTCGCKK